jgi:iron complex outermembrane receptor protein
MKCLLAILALMLALPAGAVDLRPLDASQVTALLATPARGERLIALWSLDCSYCEANLQALSRLQQTHSDRIELITVATDSITASKAITQRLRNAGMEGFAARAYADDTPDRLNYLIDPNWGGEMPHVLVIRADGTKRGVSGQLSDGMLRKLQP